MGLCRKKIQNIVNYGLGLPGSRFCMLVLRVLPWSTGILDSRTWCPLKASSGRCVMAPIESTWIWTWQKSRQGVSWWISGVKNQRICIPFNQIMDVSESSSFINLNHEAVLREAGWGRDGMMTCHYQYGRDSSWRPTHLQKADFFQHDEGRLAVQAETISLKLT